MKRIFLLCAATLSLALANVRAAEVTATLEPAQVAVGETAELTVTMTGSDDGAPTVPAVPGLDMAHVGQSTQVQIVNGAMTVSNVQTFEVTPQRGGNLHHPVDPVGQRTFPSVELARDRHRQRARPSSSTRQAHVVQLYGTAPATLPPPGVPDAPDPAPMLPLGRVTDSSSSSCPRNSSTSARWCRSMSTRSSPPGCKRPSTACRPWAARRSR